MNPVFHKENIRWIPLITANHDVVGVVTRLNTERGFYRGLLSRKQTPDQLPFTGALRVLK